MAIRRYSVFSGRVIDRQAESWGKTPHYHILLEGEGQRFRVAINTRSGTSHSRISDLLYFADDDFRHEITPAAGERRRRRSPRRVATGRARPGLPARRDVRPPPYAAHPGQPPRSAQRSRRRARFLRRALAEPTRAAGSTPTARAGDRSFTRRTTCSASHPATASTTSI